MAQSGRFSSLLTALSRSASAALVAVGVLALCACSSSRMAETAGDAGGRDLGRALDAGAAVDLGAAVDGWFGVDLGAPIDAGPRGSCDPEDVRELTCPADLCDGPDSWHWNGDRCFAISCGACEGTDCDAGFGSETACVAAHTSCEATTCRATGGDWLFWVEECGHYVCGRPQPATCIRGMPVCDCGPQRIFDAERGCVVDVSCTTEPPMPSREILCTGSGGGWENICCDTVCGGFCPAACLAPACNCGPGRVFDDARGCIESSQCYESALGERCNPRGRCADNGICCQECGGAGCFSEPTCRTPVCDTDPLVDECGNRRDAP